MQTISPKQVKLVQDLAGERETPVAGKDAKEATIIARFEDVLGGKTVSGYDARLVIDWLFKQPKAKQKTTATGMLYQVPASKYAVTVDGKLTFVEVVQRKSGARYLNVLIGAPGSWKRIYVNKTLQQKIATRIWADPKAAAKRFADEFTVCAMCLSPLSDEESRAIGLGPDCRKKF